MAPQSPLPSPALAGSARGKSNHAASAGSGAGGLGLPGFLRRRRAVLFLLFASITLLLLLNHSKPAVIGSGIRWVKDSMRPVTGADKNASIARLGPLPHVEEDRLFGTPLAGVGLQPAPALISLAQEQNAPLPANTKLSSDGKGSTSSTRPPKLTDVPTRLVMLLRLLKDPDWTVPQRSAARQRLVDPTGKQVVEALSKGSGGQQEADEYVQSPALWAKKHLPPLVIFSKTYCPFSARAKALLRELGAKFDPIEVDLRKDPEEVKSVMTLLSSGHATFPTIFLGGQMIGGADDLIALHKDLGILEGMLRGAGAI
ncbi:hypothetical protein IE81DRAFT_323359 [Ceraceosorus guamensis]|uniref:Glutaredoxin domain-containing protein n=1 Tax=Ceraceosorus guamensis TaxID=1522189 RepID=A0A316VY59_9BASI|nr:hypothetical protein IE81DRAFT_323359 [Ceraceosorus guamensis]PWN42597.1 hypothetical protein IE81DRAFT_323359 [Ceraceosorus guamensis]